PRHVRLGLHRAHDGQGGDRRRRTPSEANLSLSRTTVRRRGATLAAPARPAPALDGNRPMPEAVIREPAPAMAAPSAWSRLKVNRGWLAFWFMMPAAAFLVLFLAYPLGLGIWLSFTDARIGRPGEFIGLENYEWLVDDSKFLLAVFNTLFYTIVASAVKFAIGLYLAILLNNHLPFRAIIRAIVL